MWFLAPPSACTRLPALVPFSYTYLAMGVEPTKLTALMVFVLQDGVHRHLVAMHHVEDAVRQSRLGPAARRGAAMRKGLSPLGLSTKVLPHAIASGSNHIGTMAGKLNGVITANTPTGWLIEVTSICVETDSENPPFCRAGCRRRTRRPRDRARSRPRHLEETLPCSAVMAAASSPRRRSSSAGSQTGRQPGGIGSPSAKCAMRRWPRQRPRRRPSRRRSRPVR